MGDATVSSEELHVMEHATGWNSREPLYRNHFVTGEGSDDWPIIQGLCQRGLMKMMRKPSALSGGDPVFSVTQAGIELLPKKRTRRRR
jgi:hypothetical protein